MDGLGGMGKRRRGRAEAGAADVGGAAAGVQGSRLYCVVGSDNGFVQAWELSLDGEKGVGEQPLWSQKVCRDEVILAHCVLKFPIVADLSSLPD